jgi:hypothetical protein
MKHTPGPWLIQQGDEWTDGIVTLHGHNEDGTPIYWTVASYNRQRDEAKANARLIAAAPELLAALKDIYSGWKYLRETHGDLYGVGWDRSQEKAEAAIAKAEGA